MKNIHILRNADLTSAGASAPAGANNEKVDYSKFELTHGYGQLVKAGATVMEGVTGTITVDITFTTFKESSYEAATNEVRTVVDEKIFSELNESEHKKNYSDWWLWFHSKSSSDYEHHKEQHQETITDTDQKKVDALEKNFSTERQDYRVTGQFQVQGMSRVPTEVYLFIEMLTITTSSGETTHVINSVPVAADKDGNTDAAKVTGGDKLNILPL